MEIFAFKAGVCHKYGTQFIIRDNSLLTQYSSSSLLVKPIGKFSRHWHPVYVLKLNNYHSVLFG